jgi:rhodanese-related sulfurtransferase
MSHLPVEITPQELKAALDNGARPHLIDVREPHEFARCRIEGAELLPMHALPQALGELKTKAAEAPLVLFCHHGVRSLQAANWLRRQGLDACRSLSGGIDLWSAAIDPTVPRY